MKQRSRQSTGRTNASPTSHDFSPTNCTRSTGAYTKQVAAGRIPKPFTPEVRVFDNHKKNPAVLPKSLESTYPPDPEHKRSILRPLTCPQSWIVKNQKADLFEKAGFNLNMDDKVRKSYCRDFVERNRDLLWKYDTGYIGKTPRTVYKEITNDYFLHSKITGLYYKEKLLVNQSSERLQKCIRDDHLGSPVIPQAIDPFALSMTTTRPERAVRMTAILEPGIKEMNCAPAQMYRRGYNHEPEFGNFTSLSRVLKRNKDSECKR